MTAGLTYPVRVNRKIGGQIEKTSDGMVRATYRGQSPLVNFTVTCPEVGGYGAHLGPLPEHACSGVGAGYGNEFTYVFRRCTWVVPVEGWMGPQAVT